MKINGPNLNMLGIREPDIYGRETYATLCDRISEHCRNKGVDCEFFQSNHEGDLVDYIQKAYFDSFDGIVINPGAYTHTSVAILDAVKATRIPTVEVHISDVDNRDEFRKISYIRQACISCISGRGLKGYCDAVDTLISYIGDRK